MMERQTDRYASRLYVTLHSSINDPILIIKNNTNNNNNKNNNILGITNPTSLIPIVSKPIKVVVVVVVVDPRNLFFGPKN